MILKPRLLRKLNKSHPISRGLVGCWLFNEGSGGQVFDLSGNGNTGIITNALWAPGKFGSCLRFDGDEDYVSTTLNSTSIVIGNTVSLWMYINANKNWSVLYSANDNYVEAYLDDEGLINFYGKARMSTDSFDANFQLKQWYHLMIVETSANISLYVNGILRKSSAEVSGGGVDSTFTIGARGTSLSFDGLISHVSAYNRALSTSKIALLYQEPFCMFKRDPTELWSAATLGTPPVGMAGAMTTNSGYWGW